MPSPRVHMVPVAPPHIGIGWDSAAAAAGPAAAAPAAAGAIAASAAHERETTGALRAMQAALQDVQTVLSLHEREVESLWQATRKPDIPVAGVTHADMIDIRQLVLNLSERVSAVEARGALSSSAPIAGDAAVVIDEMNSRLNKMQQQAAQDAERYEGQLAVLREALRMSDRNGVSELKDVEARLATTAAAVANQNTAFWNGLTAALTSPNLPPASLGDPSLVTAITGMRDAILGSVAASVTTAVDEVRHGGQTQAKQLENLHDMVLAVDRKEIPDDPRTGEMLVAMDNMRAQVDRKLADMIAQVKGQQLSTVDVERRIGEALRGLEVKVETAAEDAAALRDETQHAVVEFQQRCNDVLQRHTAGVRECIEHNHAEMNANVRLCSERAAGASREVEKLKNDFDDAAAQRKRIADAVGDGEVARKEDYRQLQQMVAEKLSSVYGTVTSDLHRVQKETASELQRCEDTTAKLYRTVEELRGLQQRTLEQCHAQSDEQAKTVSRFNKVMNDINSTLKQQLTQESDRLQQIFRNDSADHREQLLRLGAELRERLSVVERRVTTGESDMDALRQRLRAMESPDYADDIQQVKNHFQTVLAEINSRLQAAETRINTADSKAANAETRAVAAESVAKAAEHRAEAAEAKADSGAAKAEMQALKQQLQNVEGALQSCKNDVVRASEEASRAAPMASELAELRAQLGTLGDSVERQQQQSQVQFDRHFAPALETIKTEMKRVSRDSDEALDLSRGLQMQVNEMVHSVDISKLRSEIEEVAKKLTSTSLFANETAGRFNAFQDGFDDRFSRMTSAELGNMQKSLSALQKRFEDYKEKFDELSESAAEVQRMKHEVDMLRGRVGM
eukprot:TRINITY_DN202_c0_g1_i2.p1 TRINITY_DN202_c0_g1~~TRINITY_DN202_c0_g1_i2.p1  ORF type:complete len:885 (+),score=341.69 TRINITY_DN202_c0_g1_i2:94-2655(+)